MTSSTDPSEQVDAGVGRRVVILGSGGSGKSTLARRVGASTGLPVTHLDVLWYRPGWVRVPTGEAVAAVRDVSTTEAWIIEGEFLDHLGADGRRERADTIIFLDRSPVLCVLRTLRRWLSGRGRDRDDLPVGCPESLDWDNLVWVAGYRRNDRPRVLKVLANLPAGVVAHRLRSGADVRRLMSTMARAPDS